MRPIIIISNDIQFKWHITGSTEEFLLSLNEEELNAYFEFKYSQLLAELKATTDAEVHVLDTEVEII